MPRPIRLALALIAVLALPLSAAQAGNVTWERSFTVTGVPDLVLHTNDGSVHVATVEGSTVGVRVAAHGWRIGANEIKVDSNQQGDRIEVTARMPVFTLSFGFSHGMDIEVTLPAKANLEIETSDGSVRLEPHTGTIRVHTHDGSITADGLRGDLTLVSGDGSIEATGLDGRLNAHTSDGHMRVEGRFEALEVSSGDGRIQLDANPGSRLVEGWTIRTSDGGVDLHLPRDLKAHLDAHSGDGHITLDMPVEIEGELSRSSVVGNLNGGGPLLKVRSGDGSIRIAAR
jgi:DUF4097 and DUF4098 domain-containing protein YvlB